MFSPTQPTTRRQESPNSRCAPFALSARPPVPHERPLVARLVSTCTIRDLRSLLDCIRFVRRTAVQTAVRLITTGILLALIAGLAIKLKFFNNGS
jgi:hypothetical protein